LQLPDQYALGLTYSTPGIFYTTAGSLPFDPNARIPNNTSEPYTHQWLGYMLSTENLPQMIPASNGDDGQTVHESYANRVCMGLAALGVHGVSPTFTSGDYSVGDVPSILPIVNSHKYSVSVTTVGATVYMLEAAAPFPGGGFSDNAGVVPV
ncbi:hypothetical protein EDC04DRAFT_2743309, partial [Pisolithus marmoratus]